MKYKLIISILILNLTFPNITVNANDNSIYPYHLYYDSFFRKSNIISTITENFNANRFQLINTSNNEIYTNWIRTSINTVELLTNTTLSRGEVAPLYYTVKAKDIDRKAWYYNSVIHMLDLGLIDNTEYIHPTDFITKKEIMDIVLRYHNVKLNENDDIQKIFKQHISLSFKDINNIAKRKDIVNLISILFEDYSVEVVKKFKDVTDDRLNRLLNQGIISGDQKGNYSPNSLLTKVEFYSIMSRGISNKITSLKEKGN